MLKGACDVVLPRGFFDHYSDLLDPLMEVGLVFIFRVAEGSQVPDINKDPKYSFWGFLQDFIF